MCSLLIVIHCYVFYIYCISVEGLTSEPTVWCIFFNVRAVENTLLAAAAQYMKRVQLHQQIKLSYLQYVVHFMF